LVAGDKF